MKVSGLRIDKNLQIQQERFFILQALSYIYSVTVPILVTGKGAVLEVTTISVVAGIFAYDICK